MTRGWTEERRKKQAEIIKRTRPWDKATGPKTRAGKARSSVNAIKHGERCRFYDEYRYMLWLNREFLRQTMIAVAAENRMEHRTIELKDFSLYSSKIKRIKSRRTKCSPTE